MARSIDTAVPTGALAHRQSGRSNSQHSTQGERAFHGTGCIAIGDFDHPLLVKAEETAGIGIGDHIARAIAIRDDRFAGRIGNQADETAHIALQAFHVTG